MDTVETPEHAVYRPRDCYSLTDLVTRYVPNADLSTPAGRHRARRSILFARQHKGLPHVYFGTRTIMYPREPTDRWLVRNQRHCVEIKQP